MKLLRNIILPLALAVIAGILNLAVLSKKTETHSYIEARTRVAAGEMYDLDDFKRVEVTAEVPSAIPWDERNVLATLQAPRMIEEGDWILRSDIVPAQTAGIQLQSDEVALNVALEGITLEHKLLHIGQPIGFAIRKIVIAPSASETGNNETSPDTHQIVGPFRLVTLGAFVTEIDESNESADAREPRTISVAVPSKDGKTLDTDAQLLSQAIEQRSITAIVFYPSTSIEPAKPKTVAEQ